MIYGKKHHKWKSYPLYVELPYSRCWGAELYMININKNIYVRTSTNTNNEQKLKKVGMEILEIKILHQTRTRDLFWLFFMNRKKHNGEGMQG